MYNFACLYLIEGGQSMNGSNIKVKNVNKIFDDFYALNDVNIDIKAGEFYSLLGPSGCGKTTLLRMIGGFDEPSDGIIYLDNTNLLELPPNKRPVNTIFQSYALFPHLNVYENIAFPLRLKKYSEQEIKEKVQKNLSLVKLEEHIYKMPSQLSGGQKQRIAIARALVNQPKVLLLDEPLSALDAQLRQHMLLELDSIHDEVGITFIFVTHDQQEALSVSDRIAVMNEGRVLQIGSPFEIYETPADKFVANFIGETNFIKGKVTEVLDKYAKISSENVGDIYVYLDKKVEKGSTVHVTVRPEKIRITKEKPQNLPETFNLFSGKANKLIYKGFQTNFFVDVNEKFTFKVLKQHARYILDEGIINWHEDVYIWWNVDDGFIVEVEQNES